MRPFAMVCGLLTWCGVCCVTGAVVYAQEAQVANSPTSATNGSTAKDTASAPLTSSRLPNDYVIGVNDILSVVFWREKDLSADVVVRPDGKISLPMLNDVQAVGLTPQELAQSVEIAARKYVRDSGATVMVKEIHSRKVYVVGEVAKPGGFPLDADMNVLQALAQAGGLLEDAHKGDVVIVRNEKGVERRFRFDYNEVIRGTNTSQNIKLRPGDTILVR
jgi:polysaccharide export outer membrane protein